MEEYTEKLQKKDLHNSDNHDGEITHLQPHSLECEVKWALRIITTNKGSGSDGIPVEQFQILMLKILQAKLQQYMNHELPDVQAGFRKSRGTRDQIANIRWIMEKAREFQKNIYFFFTDYAKAFDCVDHNKLWKILKEMRILDHLTCI